MSRNIEADDIKMAMSLYGFSSPDQTITEFVEDTLPTADVVDVVRCRDCRYFKDENICEATMSQVTGNDYCSFAERKEETK